MRLKRTGAEPTLRTALPEDAPILARWWGEGSLMAWVGFPRGLQTDVADLTARIRAQAEAGSLERLWIIEVRGSSVGEAFHRLEGPQAEVGLKIWDEVHRGRGWGRTSLALLLEHLWNTTSVDAVVLDTWEKNGPARRCYEALGFVCQGPLPPWTDQEGIPRTAVAYRLERHQRPAASPASR